jgi:hypothetical protein
MEIMVFILLVGIFIFFYELPENMKQWRKNLKDLTTRKEFGPLLFMIALPVVLFLFLFLYGLIASH